MRRFSMSVMGHGASAAAAISYPLIVASCPPTAIRHCGSSTSAPGRPSGVPHRASTLHQNARGPTKDRYPPMATDLADPRRRLAVLIDGSTAQLLGGLGEARSRAEALSSSALHATVLPAILRVGVPVLFRVFAHELGPEWRQMLEGGSGDGTSSTLPLPQSSTPDAPSVAPPLVQVEYFRVERFIPVPMQIEADAQHLFDFRLQNKVEGVCYVVHEADRMVYENVLQRQRQGSHGPSSATFFNQYLFDELGVVVEDVVDRRSADGS